MRSMLGWLFASHRRHDLLSRAFNSACRAFRKMPADPETSTKQKSFLQFNPRLDVRVRGRIKRERGYDYPELHTEDSATRRLLVRTLLEKQLQIH